jgi:hypothetical protein
MATVFEQINFDTVQDQEPFQFYRDPVSGFLVSFLLHSCRHIQEARLKNAVFRIWIRWTPLINWTSNPDPY